MNKKMLALALASALALSSCTTNDAPQSETPQSTANVTVAEENSANGASDVAETIRNINTSNGLMGGEVKTDITTEGEYRQITLDEYFAKSENLKTAIVQGENVDPASLFTDEAEMKEVLAESANLLEEVIDGPYAIEMTMPSLDGQPKHTTLGVKAFPQRKGVESDYLTEHFYAKNAGAANAELDLLLAGKENNLANNANDNSQAAGPTRVFAGPYFINTEAPLNLGAENNRIALTPKGIHLARQDAKAEVVNSFMGEGYAGSDETFPVWQVVFTYEFQVPKRVGEANDAALTRPMVAYSSLMIVKMKDGSLFPAGLSTTLPVNSVERGNIRYSDDMLADTAKNREALADPIIK